MIIQLHILSLQFEKLAKGSLDEIDDRLFDDVWTALVSGAKQNKVLNAHCYNALKPLDLKGDKRFAMLLKRLKLYADPGNYKPDLKQPELAILINIMQESGYPHKASSKEELGDFIKMLFPGFNSQNNPETLRGVYDDYRFFGLKRNRHSYKSSRERNYQSVLDFAKHSKPFKEIAANYFPNIIEQLETELKLIQEKSILMKNSLRNAKIDRL